jgi:hypothetical protein
VDIDSILNIILPLLHNAGATLDNDREVIIRTGLTAPAEPA